MAWDQDKEKKAAKNMTIGGCVFGLVFSIFWCIAALSMGAGFMLIFGIPFAGMMAYRLYVLLQLSKEDAPKKSDPWDRPAAQKPPRQEHTGEDACFCPYCGAAIADNFAFCPHCGRRQP